jgi:hypothetical protein
MSREDALRDHLVQLLGAENAHLGFGEVVAGLPAPLRGAIPPGAEHSAWQLLEHLRLAQRDILEYSRDPRHRSPPFPEGYWPASPEPPDEATWEASVEAFGADLAAMQALLADPAHDLFAEFPYGEGGTLLGEALLLADHNAYHLGQLVLLRRLLGAWPP